MQEDGVVEIAGAAFGRRTHLAARQESADPTGIYRVTVFMDRAFGAGKDNDHIGSCPDLAKECFLLTSIYVQG